MVFERVVVVGVAVAMAYDVMSVRLAVCVARVVVYVDGVGPEVDAFSFMCWWLWRSFVLVVVRCCQ